MMLDFALMAQQCAPAVHHTTMQALVRVESGFNPFAIGVVGGQLVRQPTNAEEAIATVRALEASGFNYSLGLSQVNKHNLPKFGLDVVKAFEPCENLRVGSLILKECFERARGRFAGEQQALQAAFSCYYSGNFSTGFKRDFVGQPSYVQKVLNSAGVATAIPLAKAVKPRAEPVKLMADVAPASQQPSIVTGTRDESVMVFR